MAEITLEVDGREREIDAEPEMPLLYALRNDLGMKGPKFGCGLSQCGACTVIMDGAAVRSCVTPVSAAAGRSVRTLEGLASSGQPHPVQAAFIEEEATQCGYCVNGWIMTAVAGLEADPARDEAELREMLAGLKCRCGSHMAMLRAVRRAADAMRGGGEAAQGGQGRQGQGERG